MGAQVSVAQVRCSPQCDIGGGGPKDPQSLVITSPQLFPVFPVQHRRAVGCSPPSHPLWQGLCFRIFLCNQGQSPRARSLEPSAPSSVCFPVVSLELPGPWDAPGRGQGSTSTGVGTVTAPARDWGPQGHPEHPLQDTRAAPLCQPCTVRGTRSSESLHRFKGSRDRRGASCQGALGLVTSPSPCCGWLQCQGSPGSMPGGGSRVLVPGRRRMKAAAPLGKHLRQVPSSHLLHHQPRVPSGARAACPGCPVPPSPHAKITQGAAEFGRTLLK